MPIALTPSDVESRLIAIGRAINPQFNSFRFLAEIRRLDREAQTQDPTRRTQDPGETSSPETQDPAA